MSEGKRSDTYKLTRRIDGPVWREFNHARDRFMLEHEGDARTILRDLTFNSLDEKELVNQAFLIFIKELNSETPYWISESAWKPFCYNRTNLYDKYSQEQIWAYLNHTKFPTLNPREIIDIAFQLQSKELKNAIPPDSLLGKLLARPDKKPPKLPFKKEDCR